MKIKLRAWNGTEFLTNFSIDNDGETIFTNGTPFDVEDDEIELNLCTGKQDVDGVDIFEDDLLENENEPDGVQVVWDEETCGFMKEYDDGSQDVLGDDEKVIGNIFQSHAKKED